MTQNTRVRSEMKAGDMRTGIAGQALSEQALRALIDIGTSRQGATVPDGTSVGAIAELVGAGLIGQGRGLTRSGGIRRDREVSRLIDEAF